MIEVVVTQIDQVTPTIRRISLAALEGDPLPPFQAGAHIDVHLPNGLTRQYSLTGQPGDTDLYHLGILKDAASRGGSQWLHDHLTVGDQMRISPPRNLFPLNLEAQRHLLFAGGIGITPLMSMARYLSAIGADFELTYCVRSLAEAAFVEDLTGLVPTGRLHLMTQGRDLARNQCLAALAVPRPDSHIYVCGPQGYIQTLLDLARQQGWRDDQLHTESFGASAPPTAEGNSAFEVYLARSDATITVAPHQTVVRALEQHGFDIPVSCEQGICGTCLTRVMAGIPDHRDQYLTDEERDANDQFTPCCSRARSARLVLDL